MKYRLLIISFHICAVMLFNMHVVAQDKDTASEDTLISYNEEDGNTTSSDTVLEINAFAVNDDSIAGHKRDRDFSYMNYLDSLLKRSKDLSVDTVSSDNLKGQKKLKRSTGFRINSNAGGNIFKNPLVKILLTTIAVFFIGFILFRLFFSEAIFKRTGFQRKEEKNDQEKVTDANGFNRFISDAVANNDYRLAIRYMYLQTLEMLFFGNVLEFSPDKTNDNYVRELMNTRYQHEFALVTMNYEYVWYGKFDIDHELFKRLQNNFKHFQQSI